MSKGVNKIIAGAIGGMVGGVVMSLALMGTRRIAQRVPALEGAFPNADDTNVQSLGKELAASAALGGVYGVMRSALHLPGLLFGPVYGLANYGLERVGFGPAITQTKGPWNENSMGIAPRMITSIVYGTVADWVGGFIMDLL